MVVTLRMRFDETAIGPRRPHDLPLKPGPRDLWVLDAVGARYPPLPEVSGPPLDQPLSPGASVETRFTFAVPAAARGLRLWVQSAPWPKAWVIGHENSPFHGKVLFDLGEDPRDSSASAR
jgi:hypothetical protein